MITSSTHCERCGHNLSDHDTDGTCMHRVEYGGRHGTHICPCDNYLRGVGTLAEELGRALFASPGRDATGQFYNNDQARRVGRLAEALLDTITPTQSINALELLEGWSDAAPVGEFRNYVLTRGVDGSAQVQLYARWASGAGHYLSNSWTHASLTPRDAAAKAIMKAGQEGHGS